MANIFSSLFPLDAPTLDELSRSRRNNFDFIRFLLSCCVIFTHTYIIIKSASTEPTLLLTRGQTQIATVAVDFFFVISGFLICASWMQSRSMRDYFFKRAIRIYPALIVATLFCLLIAGPLGTTNLHDYLTSHSTRTFFIRQLLFHKDPLLYGTFKTSGTPDNVMGSVVTLRYEVLAYIALALLGLCGLLKKRGVVLALFAFCFVCYNVPHLLHPQWSFRVPFFGGGGDYYPRLQTYFLAGMCFYLYRDKIVHTRFLAWLAFGLLVASCAFGAGFHWLLPLCGTYLLFYIAYSRSFRLHDFGKRGDFSYGIYLYGYPVGQLLFFHFAGVRNPLVQFVAATVVSCALAALSWHLVEKRALRLKPKTPPTTEAVTPESLTETPVVV